MKPQRIPGGQAFRRFSTIGQRYRRGPLTLVVDRSAPGPAVAFAISRHVGNAVVRNRLRRRLLTLLEREHLPNAALLVRAHPQAAECTFRELSVVVRDLFGAVGAARGPEVSAP